MDNHRVPHTIHASTLMTDFSRMWNQDDDREYVAYYLEKLRRGENAFFGLIECPGGNSIVPLLKEEFRREADSNVRVTLINVIARFRLPSSIPFFVEALRDQSPSVWKAALNGFFYIPSTESLVALEAAAENLQDTTQDPWLAEAIDQLRDELAKGKES